jgi:hypothetical protein
MIHKQQSTAQMQQRNKSELQQSVEELRVIDLKLEFKSVREIANVTGLTKMQIESIWANYLSQEAESTLNNLGQKRQALISLSEKTMEQAMESYRLSCEPVTKTIRKRIKDKETGEYEMIDFQQVTERRRSGDVKFLELIDKTINTIAEISGVKSNQQQTNIQVVLPSKIESFFDEESASVTDQDDQQ